MALLGTRGEARAAGGNAQQAGHGQATGRARRPAAAYLPDVDPEVMT